MAVTRVNVATTAPAGTASFTVTLPASYTTGDRLILFVGGKYDTTTVPTIDQSWVLLASGTGGTGSAGNDTGTTFWAVYAKDATSASETAPVVTAGATAPNSWEAVCFAFRPDTGYVWRDTITTSSPFVASGTDTNTASALTATAGALTNQPGSGDAVAAFGVIPTDTGTALGTTTITATGLSGGTVTTTSGYVENALGADTASVAATWTGFTGTATAGMAMSFTVTSSTNHSGSVVAVALRQVTTAAKAATLTESFSAALDGGKWATTGAPVVASGQLQIVPTSTYDGIQTVARYDLTESEIVVEFVQAPNASALNTTMELQVGIDDSNSEYLMWYQSTLIFREKAATVNNDTSITYNATTHRWVRIRESAGSVFWDTSPDGTTWTQRRTRTASIALTSVLVRLTAGTFAGDTGTGTAIFDNVNPPAVPPIIVMPPRRP